jgi:hypothetical protein
MLLLVSRRTDHAMILLRNRLTDRDAQRQYLHCAYLALGKDAPLGRAVQRSGVIVAIPILSGLHHQYVRI